MSGIESGTGENVKIAIEKYGDMLFRICFVMLGNRYDAEDAVQDTFIRYIRKRTAYESEDHEKAWLIRVATNRCRDLLRFRFRHATLELDSISDHSTAMEEGEMIEALFRLPPKLKSVMYLYYVEGYRVDEIAEIISRTTSAVKMRLKKGREELKKEYFEEK